MVVKLEIKDSVGTLKYNPNFDEVAEAKNLAKAMKKLGTDENAVIHFLCQPSNYKKLVSNYYFQLYGNNLLDVIKSELSGDFRNLALVLMKSPTEMACDFIYLATKGFGTNEELLISVLLTRTNKEREDIISLYNSMNKKSLSKVIELKTSGVLKIFLVGLLEGQRDELSDEDKNSYVYKHNIDGLIDKELSQLQAQQANKLLSSKEKIKETNLLNEIFIHQNRFQAAACLQEYYKLTGKDFMESGLAKFKNDDQMLLKHLVNWTLHPVGYFSFCLQNAIRGLGTDENLLNFVIADRCEKDLKNVLAELERETGKSPQAIIKSETSGDYCKLLLSLI